MPSAPDFNCWSNFEAVHRLTLQKFEVTKRTIWRHSVQKLRIHLRSGHQSFFVLKIKYLANPQNLAAIYSVDVNRCSCVPLRTILRCWLSCCERYAETSKPNPCRRCHNERCHGAAGSGLAGKRVYVFAAGRCSKVLQLMLLLQSLVWFEPQHS